MEDSAPASTKKKVFLPIVIILVLVVIALMTIKASVHKEVRLNSQVVEMVEGAEVPNFQLTYLNEKKIAIDDLPYKVMLINFWASWCDACMDEMPSLMVLRERYLAQGFEVLGVNVDDNPSSVVPPILKSRNIKFPIFTDLDGALSGLFDVHAIPLSVIVSKKRKILYIETGGREWNEPEFHQMLEKWLKD